MDKLLSSLYVHVCSPSNQFIHYTLVVMSPLLSLLFSFSLAHSTANEFYPANKPEDMYRLGTLLFSCAKVSKCGKTFVICRKLASFLLFLSKRTFFSLANHKLELENTEAIARNYCRLQFAQLAKSLSHSPSHIAWASIKSKLHANCIDKFWLRCAIYQSVRFT